MARVRMSSADRLGVSLMGRGVVKSAGDLGVPRGLQRHQVALVLHLGQAAKAVFQVFLTVGIAGAEVTGAFGQAHALGGEQMSEHSP